ncbi:NADH-quinone oxidoreductase subunit A [candidate division KSB1 bacterium]|nr:NADH-quinone oxidoreductase subunit A [candidate division KSB1 bacterium]MBL7095412.1 NADH-quinone oxidoreductase subunit A [candidate division KSB1 bacterium]
MTEQYLPVLLYIVIAALTAALILLLNKLLGPKAKHRKDYPSKLTPFECGSDLLQDNNRRVSIRFYLIALLFVLFDLEGILLYPWAVVGRSLGKIAIIEIFIFLFFLVVAFIYAYRRKAFDWR